VAQPEREKHPPHRGDPVEPSQNDQATQSAQLAEDRPLPERGTATRSRVFAFGGGKGGVGKTVLAACFGVTLARSGKRVILVDADLGGSNLHVAMGMEIPTKTLHDFMSRRVRSLSEIVCETPIANLRFVSGAPGVAGMANRKFWEKQKLIRHIRRLQADFTLVDIGAGMSFNEIDLFLAADTGIVVANPEPPSIQEAYNFIKVCLFRRLTRLFGQDPEVSAILQYRQDPSHHRDTRLLADILAKVRKVDSRAAERLEETIAGFRPRLILNMVHHADEAIEAMALEVAVHDLLGLTIDNWGEVPYDPAVLRAIRSMRPERLLPPGAPCTNSVEAIARKHFMSVEVGQRLNPNLAAATEGQAAFGDGEEVICSYRCDLWGNCSLQHGGFPCRIKYVGFARQNNGTRRARDVVAA